MFYLDDVTKNKSLLLVSLIFSFTNSGCIFHHHWPQNIIQNNVISFPSLYFYLEKKKGHCWTFHLDWADACPSGLQRLWASIFAAHYSFWTGDI